MPKNNKKLLALLRQPPRDLEEKLHAYHEMDVALALPLLTQNERKRLFGQLSDDPLSEILAYSDNVAQYLCEMNVSSAARLIENMDSDDAIDVLEQLEPELRARIEALLDEESKEDIRLIDSFSEECFGHYMTTNFIEIPHSFSVKETMRSLVAQAAENDNISTLYVTEGDGRYCGAVDLKDLIVAREGVSLDSLIMTSYPFVYATDELADKIEQLKDYSEDSIPVLDAENKILGVITAQDMIEIVDDEMGEDYARLAGLTAEADLNESLLKSITKRLPWLMVLLVLGLAVSGVIGAFEGVIQSLTIVVCFQSLILDMAGNSGTQSLAVTIRVLSDETLSTRQKFVLVGKEVRVSLCNGMILGILAFLGVGVYVMLFKSLTVSMAFSVSACIGAALWIAMLIAGFTGTMIPIGFSKLGVDPAVASGPLITTINDLVAVVTYYGLAWLFLIKLLGY